MARSIERRLIEGVWTTVDVEEDTGGGSTPDLAAVLAEGGDPDGNTVTGPLTIDLSNPPYGAAIARLRVLADAGFPIFAVSGAGLGTPTLGGVPTLHADEHGVTVSLDGLSQGFLVANRVGDTPFSVAATGGVQIAPPAGSTDDPLIVWDADGVQRLYVGLGGSVYFAGFQSRITPAGAYATSVHAAPADGDISAGECALWFDQTNGAAKLMIKGKTANGTVVTGNVPLT